MLELNLRPMPRDLHYPLYTIVSICTGRLYAPACPRLVAQPLGHSHIPTKLDRVALPGTRISVPLSAGARCAIIDFYFLCYQYK